MHGRTLLGLAASLLVTGLAGCQSNGFARHQFATERSGRTAGAVAKQSKLLIGDERPAGAAAFAESPASGLDILDSATEFGTQRANKREKPTPESEPPGKAEIQAPGKAELHEPGRAEILAPGKAEILAPGKAEILRPGTAQIKPPVSPIIPALIGEAPPKKEPIFNASLLLPDPKVRSTPTSVEGSTDKVKSILTSVEESSEPAKLEPAADLKRKLEIRDAENAVLLGRVNSLESAAEEREQAINEALREVESASVEVTRTRTELQKLRKELTALRERMRQAEKDDLEALRAVIAALERMLEPPAEPQP